MILMFSYYMITYLVFRYSILVQTFLKDSFIQSSISYIFLSFLGSVSVEHEAADEPPRSIIVDDGPHWTDSDPFFQGDEEHSVQRVLHEFFADNHTPSYLIDSQPSSNNIDPQDGAVAGPSGLCKQRLKNGGGSNSSSSEKPTNCNNSQVHEGMACHHQEKEASNVSLSVVIIMLSFSICICCSKVLMILLIDERVML